MTKPPENPHDIWNQYSPWGPGVDDLQAASHLPLFLACIAATEGPVLEIGVGFHSTPIIHSLLGALGREFVSAESNPYWIDVFKPDYTCALDDAGFSHTFLLDDYPTLKTLTERHWGVVLVDDSPGPPRCDNVSMFLPVSDYVLVHDAQGEDIMVPMRPVIKDVPYQFMHKRYYPWALALSNFRPIPHVP
jgi:hypothetical protein